MNKKPLVGLTLEQLQTIAVELALPKYIASQIADWIYKKRVNSIDRMTNLSVATREKLSLIYNVGLEPPVSEQISNDGTAKYLFRAEQNHFIESVFIPDRDRATLCVSSQVGCKMNCLFCMTGKMGFVAHLTTSEILNQVLSVPDSTSLTNIVFMGMGEPLDNVDQVLTAIEILTAPWGLAWSPRRITVSTIGVEKGLRRLLEESQCHVAVSLHNPCSEERLAMMPVERAFPIQRIISLLSSYDFFHQRRLSFEYIMFKGVNDSLAHAEKLVKLVRSVRCRVNIIRFHEFPQVDLRTSDDLTMLAFRDYLNNHGVIATIRSSRGEDILAACGMLSTEEINAKK